MSIGDLGRFFSWNVCVLFARGHRWWIKCVWFRRWSNSPHTPSVIAAHPGLLYAAVKTAKTSVLLVQGWECVSQQSHLCVTTSPLFTNTEHSQVYKPIYECSSLCDECIDAWPLCVHASILLCTSLTASSYVCSLRSVCRHAVISGDGIGAQLLSDTYVVSRQCSLVTARYMIDGP